MDVLLTDLPFGTPVLHSLFDEFVDSKSPFNLKKYYKVNKNINYGSYISFLGGYVPKYLNVNGVEIMENTSFKDFNKIIEGFPKEFSEKSDADLIIPLAIRCDYFFSSILGHFTTCIIKKRNNKIYIDIFDSKKEDISGRFLQILSFLEESDLDPYECKINYCATQKSEDIVNCGYYMFKVIYNYLLLSSSKDREDKKYAINPNPGERDLTEIVGRIITGTLTEPYNYENIIVDGYTINFLTLKERNYLYETIKRERIRSQGLLNPY